MDVAETASNAEVKHNPPVPIKTYQWEDVRRAREKGGYPWTYIDKDPFDENAKMEEKKKPQEDKLMTVGSTSSIDVSVSQYLDADVPTPGAEGPSVSASPDQMESKRAKSEEPGRKRKLSIDSSYSRVSKYSLSRLGFLKRLKETKIKLPKFSFSKSESRLNKKSKPLEAEVAKPQEKIEKPKKIVGPMYIHIPLKPPPGETDEFSHLEFDDQKRPTPIKEETKEEATEQATPETPIDPTSPVQFIILTAPSDDEILDDTPIPETPSETDKKFFDNNRINELKSIARDVVDRYSPETKRRSITNKEGVIIEEIEDEVETKDEQPNLEIIEEIKEESPSIEVKEKSEVEIVEVVEEVKDEPMVIEEIEVKEPIKKKKKGKKEKAPKLKIPESRKTDDDKLKEQDDIKRAVKINDDAKVNVTKEMDVAKQVNETDNIGEPIDVINNQVSEDVKKSMDDEPMDVSQKEIEAKHDDVTSIIVEDKPMLVEEIVKQEVIIEDEIKKQEEEMQIDQQIKSIIEEKPVKVDETVKLDEKMNVDEPKIEDFKLELKEVPKTEEASKKSVEATKPVTKDIKSILKDDRSTKVTKKEEIVKKVDDKSTGKTKKEPLLARLKGKFISSKAKVEEAPVKVKTPTVVIKEKDRNKDTRESYRIPLHSEESMDRESLDLRNREEVIDDQPIDIVAKPILEDITPKEIIVVEEKPIDINEKQNEIDDTTTLKDEPINLVKEEEAIKKDDSIKQDDENVKSVENVNVEDKVKPIDETIKKEVKPIDETIKKEVKPIDETVKEEENPVVEKEEIKDEMKMSVDEEDGLKTEATVVEVLAEIIKEDVQELKKLSPILKKRVSFKRRSKEEKEGIYEDVQIAGDSANLSQSMSVDEEKSYLDGKIMKDTSLEEDYNKWSKVNDHEYEPINPPQEEVVQTEHRTKKASTPVTDSDIEFLAARAADIEMRTTGIITVQDQQSKGVDAIFVPLSAVLKEPEVEEKKEPPAEGHGKKFQEAIKHQATNLRRQASILGEKASSQAEKIHTRVRSIKRPKIDKPKFKKPNLPKLKISKPNMPKFNRPKMPEFKRPQFKKPTMPHFKRPNMPHIKKPNISFTLPKRKEGGGAHASRQYSTESNYGDSKRNIFDFSTYPRIFKKKKEQDEEVQTPRNGTDITPDSERSTLPSFSRWKGKFIKAKVEDVPVQSSTSVVSKESERSTDTRDSYRIPLHSEESMDRESLDLRSREARESVERSRREDSLERRMALDKIEAENRYRDEMELESDYIKENQEIQRASSMNEKLNERWSRGTFQPQVTDLDAPQERPPQESSSSGDLPRRGVLEEINSDEFFLRQKGISEDNMEVVAYLSSEIREAFRTPSNALNQMEDIRSSNHSLPEAPKRRPMKKPKRKKTPHVSQEAIQYDQESINTEPEEYPKEYYREEEPEPERPRRRNKKNDDVDLDGLEDQILRQLNREISDENILYENEHMQGIEQPGIVVSDPYQEAFFHVNPSAPPRKHKSLKSLNDSMNEENLENSIERYRMEHEYQIPTPDEPPRRPFRTRSRTRSQSRSIQQEEDLSSKRTDSLDSECVPCVEEPCSRVLCDYMGYSVIDKSRIRDPPLPPCAPRRKRSVRSNVSEQEQERFFTVPRRLHNNEQPIRPLRNYSTLGPSRPPRKRSVPNLTDEDKENITGSQYIEMEDDYHTKNLHSGDVIQKMRDRPLPAPPRPPRRGKDNTPRAPLRDITPEKNLQEAEVSVQTEPLPDDFVCEELVHEEHDKVITPSVDKKPMREFEHQETITHGALIVQPFSGEIEETPMESFSKSTERIITIRREVDEDSEIPEEFTLLQSPAVIERIIERHVPVQLEPNQEVELLKTQKLQVADLDVDRLAVNELHASKIKVGEIESSSINVNEINSNTGNLVVSGIELPPSFFRELVEKLQEQKEKDEAEKAEQKKTPIEENVAPQKPPRTFEPAEKVPETVQEHIYEPIDDEEPSASEESKPQETVEETHEEVPETVQAEIVDQVDEACEEEVSPIYEEIKTQETPPPRPPQPTLDPIYLPSQPPPSFYALRSPPVGFKDFDIDDDIPMAPRRRRPHKAAIPSVSSSEDEAAAPSRRRHRTPEPSIPQLTGHLTRACVTAADQQLKRLLRHLTQLIIGHSIPGLDGKQDVNVAVVVLLVLVASIILLGWGNGKNVHHHHWEYFNPPKDI